MESRLRYRDIPWGVAFCVLPGKIIGRCVIDPCVRFSVSWKRIMMRWLQRLLIFTIVIVVVGLLLFGIDALTQGEFFGWLLHIWHQVSPPPDTTDVVLRPH